jgi:hypothetical protein
LFLTYFWHSYAGGKFRQAYTEIFFRKVVYIKYDIPWFTKLVALVC